MEKSKRKNDKSPIKIWSKKRFFGVIVLAVAYGWFSWYTFAELRFDETLSPAFISFLIFVPIAIGAFSIYTIPPVLRTPFRVITLAIATIILFLVVAVISNPVILLCVAMAAFPIVALGAIGALLNMIYTKYMRNKKKKNTQYAIAGLLLILPYVLAPIEANVEPTSWYRTVETEVIINDTTPEEVWNSIVRMQPISPAEQRPSWYHLMGIPRPTEATLEGEGVGSIRTGYFESGLSFEEEVTLWQPYRAMEFDVEVLLNSEATPVLREIGGAYYDLISAGYELEAVDDHTVRLSLHSEYRLSTNFNFYGAIWADWIMEDFQNYVLNTVKTRIENN